MAEKMIRKVYDDLDGTELNEGEWERVSFSLGDKHYEIDLSNKNIDALHETLAKYIEAARSASAPKRGRPAGTTVTATRKSSGSGLSKDELKSVRDWAKREGIEVSDRGRVAADVIEKYQAAHQAKVS